MNIRMLWTAAAALTVALSIAGPARAEAKKAGTSTPTGEAAAPMAAEKASGTHETRKAARKERRQEVAAEAKKGDIKNSGEATAPMAAEKASGTHETRKAARKERRQEVAAEAKKGDIKNPGEAGEPKK